MAFCFQCGRPLRGDETFCGGCGAKVPVQEESFSETGKGGRRKIVLITVISILLLAALGTGLYFALRKGESGKEKTRIEQIEEAFRKTLKAKSYAFAITVTHDGEESSYNGELIGTDETEQFYFRRKMNIPAGKYTLETAYVDGKAYARGSADQGDFTFYNELTGEEDLKLFRKLCRKDYIGVVNGSSELKQNVSHFCKNYEKLDDILLRALKDCLTAENEVAFLKSVTKKDGKYTFTCDPVELVKTLRKDYGLEIDDSDYTELLKILEMLESGDVEISFRIEDGYLVLFSVELETPDSPAILEIAFSDIDQLKAKKGSAVTIAEDAKEHLKDPDNSEVTPAPTPAIGELSPTPGPMDDEITLTMWCDVTKSDARRYSYEAAIREMEELYPNIKIQWESTQLYAYQEKLTAASRSGNLPDIFLAWGGHPDASYSLSNLYAAGRLYSLEDYYIGYAGELPEKMCGNATFGGQPYGIPTSFNVACMYVNMDLLREVGITEVPDTIQGLQECCEKLSKAGYCPFGIGAEEKWCISEYLETIIVKTCGAETLDAIYRGNADWYNGDVAAAVNLLRSLQPYFGPPDRLSYNDPVREDFTSGRYAFYVNGSWNCPDFSNCGWDIRVAEFPVVNPEKSKMGQWIGGPGNFLAVSADSDNASIAAAYAFELAKRISRYEYLDCYGIPAWSIDYDDSVVNPLTRDIASKIAQADQLVYYAEEMLPSDILELYYAKLAAIVSGEKYDGTDFVNDMNRPNIPDEPLDVKNYWE